MAETGRPLALEVTPETLKKVESLAAQGLNKKQIAHVLGVCYDTYNERQKEFPELSEAFEHGKSKGVATITNAVFNKAKKGDMQAAKYYLNNVAKENWQDKVTLGHGIDPDAPKEPWKVEFVNPTVKPAEEAKEDAATPG